MNLMSGAPPQITFTHVAKSFDGGRVKAVDDVSLQVGRGEFLAIVGSSGSGKTTLLRLANRLIEADSGSYLKILANANRALNRTPTATSAPLGYSAILLVMYSATESTITIT